MTTYTVRYNYRLRPGKHAEQLLLDEWHRCRWVWNQLVTARKQRRRFFTSADLTAARARHEWLRAGSQNCQEQTTRTFSGKGRRNLKSKRDQPSIPYSSRGFSIRDGRLRVKGAVIPVVWHRDLPSEPTSVRVFREADGHWYASFVVRVERQELPPSDAAIGIDWGVKVAATTTDPEYDFHSAGHRAAAQKNLTRYQRMMARRKPAPGKTGSKGYKNAKSKAAKAHRKVARQRLHDTRQWARKIVADHGLIAVEDFKPGFLAKTTMARKSSDNAVGMLRRELDTYARQAGRQVVNVPPAYTTMTCSDCLTIAKQRLGLDERVFQCYACGLIMDRDRNAARVILATAERLRAGAETVRHSDLPSGSVGVQVEPESRPL
jgi:putative transposase